MPTAPSPSAPATGAQSPEFQAYNKMVGDWLKANPGGRYTGTIDPAWLQSLGSGATTGGTDTVAYKNATLNDVAAGKIIPYSQLPGSPGYNAATDPNAALWTRAGIPAAGAAENIPGVGQAAGPSGPSPAAAPSGPAAQIPQFLKALVQAFSSGPMAAAGAPLDQALRKLFV